MIRFFAPDIESTLTLPESDSQHCVRVLRMKDGDRLEVVDGRGHIYECVLVGSHPKRAVVEIEKCIDAPLSWPQHITIAVAPTKHMDRMEWMVEKLTEIGVNKIVPLLCRHSERKEIKTERLEKIAVSAIKQSLKSVMPIIAPLTPFKEIAQGCLDANKFIAHCDSESMRTDLACVVKPFADTTILIGPEGDFSPEEVDLALSNHWVPVTLGNNRLRTETAAIVACDTIHIIDCISQK